MGRYGGRYFGMLSQPAAFHKVNGPLERLVEVCKLLQQGWFLFVAAAGSPPKSQTKEKKAIKVPARNYRLMKLRHHKHPGGRGYQKSFDVHRFVNAHVQRRSGVGCTTNPHSETIIIPNLSFFLSNKCSHCWMFKSHGWSVSKAWLSFTHLCQQLQSQRRGFWRSQERFRCATLH